MSAGVLNMKSAKGMNCCLSPAAAVVGLTLLAGPAFAVDFYIAAKAYNKAMPDGTEVPMWGYVDDPGGVCYNTAGRNARNTCVANLPAPEFPGPRLVVPPAATGVRIFLSNGLPEPTSIIIPGQELPYSAPNNGPTWNSGRVGDRPGPRQRVRSFGREAPPDGGRRSYVWSSGRENAFDRPGSFIYHSGTQPQKQVYMGLAGLVTKDAGAGEAYSGVPYGNEVVLFYSDIDPAFNAAVSAGSLSTAIDRHPTWFLVNGEPFVAGTTGDIPGGTAGSSTLVRLASTATDTHVAVLQGMAMTIHAEDGFQYNWQDSAGTATPAPRVQYSAMLPPVKTKDAVIVAPGEGRFAVYDGNGNMTNPSDPENESVGDSVGGMLRFLAFNAAPPPPP